jgi:hypothetical protein
MGEVRAVVPSLGKDYEVVRTKNTTSISQIEIGAKLDGAS